MIIMMQKLGSLARTSWKLPDKLSDLSPHLSFSNGSFWASSIWDRDFRVFGYLSYVYGELGFLSVSGLYWLEMLINSGLLSWKLPSKRRNQCFETERPGSFLSSIRIKHKLNILYVISSKLSRWPKNVLKTNRFTLSYLVGDSRGVKNQGFIL